MAAPEGTSIYAADAGVVLLAQWSSGYGIPSLLIMEMGYGPYTVIFVMAA